MTQTQTQTQTQIQWYQLGGDTVLRSVDGLWVIRTCRRKYTLAKADGSRAWAPQATIADCMRLANEIN